MSNELKGLKNLLKIGLNTVDDGGQKANNVLRLKK